MVGINVFEGSKLLTLPIIVAATTTLLVLGIGGWMTTVGPWYENLIKPKWNPPNWIFGPALTVILSLAAWSGVLAWTNASDSREQLLVLALFGVNIFLHMLWSHFLQFQAARLGSNSNSFSLAFDCRADDRLSAVIPDGKLASFALPSLGNIRSVSKFNDCPAEWSVRRCRLEILFFQNNFEASKFPSNAAPRG